MLLVCMDLTHLVEPLILYTCTNEWKVYNAYVKCIFCFKMFFFFCHNHMGVKLCWGLLLSLFMLRYFTSMELFMLCSVSLHNLIVRLIRPIILSILSQVEYYWAIKYCSSWLPDMCHLHFCISSIEFFLVSFFLTICLFEYRK